MDNIDKLRKHIEETGILQLGHFVTKDFVNSKGNNIHAVQTLEEYCEDMGKMSSQTADEYAASVLEFITAPTKKIIGECKTCYAMLVEGEGHVCREEHINHDTYTLPNFNDLICFENAFQKRPILTMVLLTAVVLIINGLLILIY